MKLEITSNPSTGRAAVQLAEDLKHYRDKNHCVQCNGFLPLPSGFCADCARSTIKFEIPTEHEFDREDTEFLEAPELTSIGNWVIDRFDEDFGFLREYDANIIYLWKKKGGTTNGKMILGRCQKPTGLLKHFTEADYVIWLGADNLSRRANRFIITATVFHELEHTWYSGAKGFEIRRHDFEGFGREVEVWGNYKTDIGRTYQSFKKAEQGSLFEGLK